MFCKETLGDDPAASVASGVTAVSDIRAESEHTEDNQAAAEHREARTKAASDSYSQ